MIQTRACFGLEGGNAAKKKERDMRDKRDKVSIWGSTRLERSQIETAPSPE
jgi:hypothetical protein